MEGIDIINALIAASGSLVGTIYGIISVNSKTLYRIEQLEKKQDKHNSLIERMYKLEQKVEDLDDDINN